MGGNWRQSRRAELEALWQTNPAKIIGLYQHATGLDVFDSLPNGVRLADVIDAILDHESGGRAEAESNR